MKYAHLLLSGALLASTLAATAQSDIAVVSDTGGPVSQIVLHYVPDSVLDLLPTYEDLFDSLSPQVDLQVLCPWPEAVDEFNACWLARAAAGGRRVCVVDVDRPITIWARDRRIAREYIHDGRTAATFVPANVADYQEDKRGDLGVPRLLVGRGLLPGAFSSLLHLEGGNVVSNDRHAFVGANVLTENPTLAHQADLPRILERILGRDVILVGERGTDVPWQHIDMYLTPIDDQTVLVASPALARSLLLGENCDLFADRDESEQPLPLLLYRDEELDIAAQQLESYGYNVVRLPAIIDPAEDWMITYNNVILEHTVAGRVAYMPVYHFRTLDDAAEEVYQQLGFQVRRIDVSGVYRYGGAIRCVANVIRRERVPSAPPSPRRLTNRANVPPPDWECRLQYEAGPRWPRRAAWTRIHFTNRPPS